MEGLDQARVYLDGTANKRRTAFMCPKR